MIKQDQTSKRTFYIEVTTLTGTSRKFTVENPKEVEIADNNIVANSQAWVNFGYAIVTGQYVESGQDATLNAPSISEDLQYTIKAGYDQTINTIVFDEMNKIQNPTTPAPTPTP